MDKSKRRAMFNVRIKWQVYNNQLGEINSYSYSCFAFKFHITEQDIMVEFVELIADDKPVSPSEICNFFIEKGIEFKIKYRYIKEISFKENLSLYLYYLDLKYQYFKLKLRKHIIIDKKVEKKEIEGKGRKSYVLRVYLPLLDKLYFIQSDSNIWWLPKFIKQEGEEAKIVSIGWLFSQLGCVTYKIKLLGVS